MKQFLIIGSIPLILFSCKLEGTEEDIIENDYNRERAIESIEESRDQPEQKTGKMVSLNRSIVFYNVENLFDTKNDHRTDDDDFTPYGSQFWDEERYEEKLESLSEALELISPAPMLIGLAEIENHKVLEDFLKEDRFDDHDMGFVQYDSPDRRGIDVALLYDKGLMSIESTKRFAVKMESEPNFRTRDILYVECELEDDQTIHVFVNHWSSRREGKEETEPRRIAAAETLRNEVDHLLSKDPDAQIVIMGDFNDTPLDRSIRKVLNADAINGKRNDLVNMFIQQQKADKGTSVHRGDWDVIDQIIVTKNFFKESSTFQLTSTEGTILMNDDLLYTYHNGDQKPDATYGGRKYFGGTSDHLPVYVVLK